MVAVEIKGTFKNTKSFLKKLKEFNVRNVLDKYGKEGVKALSDATPRDTGKTSESWEYEVEINQNEASIRWYNTNVVKHVNIALILQYGHGTRNGGYVVGRDYINPAIRPIFDKIAEDVWKEVIA